MHPEEQMNANPSYSFDTLGALLAWGAQMLEEAKVESARLDAELLLGHSLLLSRAQLAAHLSRRLDALQIASFSSLLQRRKAREPLAYLVGQKEFYSLPFIVNPSVLIPRPDTETLVEEALVWANSRKRLRIFEVGTGSGCIAVTLAKHLPQASIVAADSCFKALQVAKKNIEFHQVGAQVETLLWDVFTPPSFSLKECDLMVSNPPYIPSTEIADLAPEIHYEPFEALNGGEDGLDYYRRIFEIAESQLAPKTGLILEIGSSQADAIQTLLSAYPSLEPLKIRKDLAGKDRVFLAQKKK